MMSPIVCHLACRNAGDLPVAPTGFYEFCDRNSPGFYCGGGAGYVCGVALGRSPRRTVNPFLPVLGGSKTSPLGEGFSSISWQIPPELIIHGVINARPTSRTRSQVRNQIQPHFHHHTENTEGQCRYSCLAAEGAPGQAWDGSALSVSLRFDFRFFHVHFGLNDCQGLCCCV